MRVPFFRAFLALAISLGSMTAPATARADSTEAEQLFRAARAAFERREFRAAASAFEEAYRHSQHAAVLYNAGVAWQAAGDEARAADAFARSIAKGDLDADAGRDAERRLADLSARVGRIDLKGVPALTVSVAHVRDAHPPLTVYVAPGRYDIVSTAQDAPAQTRRVEVSAGATAAVELPSPPAKPRTPPPPKTEPSTVRWVVSGSLVGVSIAAVTTGAILGVSATRSLDDYAATGYTDVALRDKTADLKHAANGFFIAAGITGVAGVILFFVLPAEQTVAARITPGGVVF